MTTNKQKAAVSFCERWLSVPFKGNRNNYHQVRKYLRSCYIDAQKLEMFAYC